MAHEQFELAPAKDGSWNWQQRGASGKVVAAGPGYESRRDAYAGAREARGDVVTALYLADGSPHGEQVERGWQRIVLLRVDGSLYGELEHEVRAGGPAQHISIEPASESAEAVSV